MPGFDTNAPDGPLTDVLTGLADSERDLSPQAPTPNVAVDKGDIIGREWIDRADEAGACVPSLLWLGGKRRTWTELARDRPDWLVLAAVFIPGLAEAAGEARVRACESANLRFAILCRRWAHLRQSDLRAFRRLVERLQGLAAREQPAREELVELLETELGGADVFR